ncbi:hypothetical protein [Tropicimonas marinistellae]|uniref:hypothetical protein n=1 Tax=Tropicimonas marinistellae TaxID=1739787 RepID=UPI000831248A|nr:hypothetical protein [Tropicimonas marinistellae]
MPNSKSQTKAINLRIEVEHEQLVRDVISHIRTGGPGFRSALQRLLEDEGAAQYIPARELLAKFAELEARIKALEPRT